MLSLSASNNACDECDCTGVSVPPPPDPDIDVRAVDVRGLSSLTSTLSPSREL